MPQKKFFFLIILFIYLFLAVLGLCCCARAFSSCSEQGLLFVAVRGFLIVIVSLVAEHGLQVHGLQQLWLAGPRVQAQQLWHMGPVAPRMWDLPGPGLEPVCPLHWQADSQPLRHQGSPKICLYFEWSFYLIRYLLGCCSCLTVFQSSYFTSFRLILNVLWGNKGLELHSPSCC